MESRTHVYRTVERVCNKVGVWEGLLSAFVDMVTGTTTSE